MKTLDQILGYFPAKRRAKIAERTRQLIAEMYGPWRYTEVSGEVAKADVGEMVENAAFHRDNQK